MVDISTFVHNVTKVMFSQRAENFLTTLHILYTYIMCRVIQKETSLFLKVSIKVIVRKNSYEHVYNSECLPSYICVDLQN